MTQRVFLALLTIGVFAAGYVVRMRTERERVLPPPPTALANEYAASAKPATDSAAKRETDRAKLVAEIEKLRPQIEAYRAQVEEIYTEFDREFTALLTPKQRAKFEANQKRWAEHEAKKEAERTPLTDEDILRARERPMTDVYRMVTVTPRLEWYTKDYELDAAQQTSVRSLLTLRRNKFLALLDATPHPSIRLSRLAPMIERVAEKPKKSE